MSFRPYVRRFLYGEGRCDRTAGADAAKDIAKLRVVLREGHAPIELEVVHTDHPTVIDFEKLYCQDRF